MQPQFRNRRNIVKKEKEMTTYILIGLLIIVIILLVILLLRDPSKGMEHRVADRMTEELNDAAEDIIRSVRNIGDSHVNAISNIGNLLTGNQRIASDAQKQELEDFEDKMDLLLTTMTTSLDTNIRNMREENTRKLEEIRGTVDEKLQTTLEKRISESFKTVSDQLEQVYKGIGEMQSIASDVGGLKRVLSTVKNRGIMGEIQLAAILQDILSPEQYETNCATVPGSTERVEFAVKLPAEDGVIYLPIDSKFPGDKYAQYLDAQDAGDKNAAATALKELRRTIRQEAKDIRSKYVSVPYTTNFGILFLPFEGLYATVVNSGMLEELQRDFQINVAGPSTMAALLNSLQMGFRTLAIQKRSSEVWEVLGAVKTEFDQFEDVMKKMQTHLNQTTGDLEKLMGVRTRKIQKKLQNVQKLDAGKSETILGIEDLEYLDEE